MIYVDRSQYRHVIRVLFYILCGMVHDDTIDTLGSHDRPDELMSIFISSLGHDSKTVWMELLQSLADG
jgi:hypothetical protein